ncbi:MAG: DUF2269 family protein [Actinomycetota bacterium]|jgi:uncharacterized membrane protein|nr:DUF2269 family protein [Actinomycetota bacterium]MDA8076201.1 DUF2269 family protein [Actinomycetota bacterium]
MTPAWLYDLALCLHLLGAFSLVSGTVVAGVGFEAARRRTSCTEIALALGLARVGALLVVAGTIFAAGFGLWLVELGHWGYGTPWVDAAIGLLAMVAVIGSMGGQRPKRARLLATRLATDGLPPSAELRSLLDDRMAIALNYLAAAALLAIIVLMVVRPGSPHQ